jgi:MoxR-like ATPase
VGVTERDVAALARRILESIDRVVVGKRDVVELVLIALLCEGHVLIEDVPGVGKTTLARAAARSIGGVFRRLQFTPDLLPSDVIGLTYYNQKLGEFQLRPGPIFASVLLADEINRATPRTQSALLEAMEERTVTIEGETLPLPRPFLVLATENPVELEGTFPLPGRRTGDAAALPARQPTRRCRRGDRAGRAAGRGRRLPPGLRR